MQIIIPMSGFGERFRRAGYTKPKPLIDVDGKPIIAHVVDMFPGEHDFIFICNEDHLAESSYKMAQTLREIAPQGKIIPIPSHKLGPVNAVLKARDAIDPSQPVIVNYCDFTCYWDYPDFKRFVTETDCAGAVPAYKGFHPHSLGSTFYAYMRQSNLWMEDIQEKKPFTDNPLEEYASSGTYYFKSGALCLDAMERQVAKELTVNGEYYVSLTYKILREDNAPIAIYDLQHFMQWGTPADLEEYQNWSNIFQRLASDKSMPARQDGAILLPMAGLGSRFAKEGYDLPKPLIPVSGRPMVIQAVKDLPAAPRHHFITRADLPKIDDITAKLRASFFNVNATMLDRLTEGQAITCLKGMEGLDLDAPLTIGACDNGMLYDTDQFEQLMAPNGPDVLVWTVRGHPDGRTRPEMFGWVDADENGKINGVSVKKALSDPRNDPLIVGAFTFRNARDFVDAANALIARDGRVNGEFYVDSVIEDCVDAGLQCRIFEIDGYIGWGTPKDLSIFEYWQSCFHKWQSHPYRLEKDRRIPPSQVAPLSDKYQPTIAPRPAGYTNASKTPPSNKWLNRFLPVPIETIRQIGVYGVIGVSLVLLDIALYALLTQTTPIAPWLAKFLSVLVTVILSYYGNARLTFRSQTSITGFNIFIAIYAISIVLNVCVFEFTRSLIGAQELIAVIVASLCSAIFNFFSARRFVFRQKAA